MSTITESVNVTVPIRAAYDQWTRFETFPRFMDGVEEIRRLDDTTLRWTTRIAGVTRRFDARITEQLPDERVAWKSLDGPTHAGVVTFHRLDETTTRVTAQLEIDSEGLAEKAGDRIGALTHRVKGDLRRFKTFIESRGVQTGARRGQADRPEP
ncbi:SRPBCC family protein [Actinomadura darangshiensis]|uniref:SRPBCC family protein n=1 Tax=Actinomadura darangshiensis TaxID=705336 RepID=A0A4R5BP74_9ACTN|nr:SRPBCC family protein [Actinomadura darangshiensis]TDD88688.1 SRPBCC family protein [Actinomadura darangshiensis]